MADREPGWSFSVLDNLIVPEDGSDWGELAPYMFSDDDAVFSRNNAAYGSGTEPYSSPEPNLSDPSHQDVSGRHVNGQSTSGNNLTLPGVVGISHDNRTDHNEQRAPNAAPQDHNRPQLRTHFRPWEQQSSHNAAEPETQITEPAPHLAQQAPIPTYRENVESLDSDTEEDMPPTTRRTRNRNAGSVVDITDSPASSSTSRHGWTRKRRADSTADEAAASKRKKQVPTETVNLDEEEDDEAPSADAELLKAQQLEALKAQQGRDDGPVKIGKRTCIICLENYTNATTAACGHIFCHECLTRALMASEKNSDRGTGNCPACRKSINRKKANTLIPINFMKKSAFAQKGRKQGSTN